ncbi:MAG: 50S ribosomal protein L11 methyltransferase [Verrucomicrobiota bacterium]|jgi:ribosomal protein L11 methyltransferase
MKQKPLWRISIATTLEAGDAVAELLGATLGQSISSYFDLETRACAVSVYSARKKILPLKIREKILAGLKRIKNCGLKIGSGKITVSKVRREDWAESWKRHFKSFVIGDKLLVKPGWIKRRPLKNQAVVVLDPGLSFGTGRHPTTSFCLGQIVKRRIGGRPQSFLDLGTGSGILAIAAAKLGCRPVHALDSDPKAVRIARANARVNGLLNRIKISRGDVAKLPLPAPRQYDLICANLMSGLLVAERRRIAKQLRRGGTLVLAGILRSEFSHVQTAFEKSGLKLASAKSDKEWRSGAFCFA